MSFLNLLLRSLFGFVIGILPIALVLSVLVAAVSALPLVVVIWPVTLSGIALYVLIAFLRWHARKRQQRRQQP